MDKLLRPRLYENGNDRDRLSFENKASGYYLEAMESAEEEAVGTAKARNR